MIACSSFTGLIPEVQIREVTIKPTMEVGDDDVVLSVRLAIMEDQVGEDQDLWTEDIELVRAMKLQLEINTSGNNTTTKTYDLENIVKTYDGVLENITETGEVDSRATVFVVEQEFSLQDVNDVDLSASILLNIETLVESYGLDPIDIEGTQNGSLPGQVSSLSAIKDGMVVSSSVQDLRSLAPSRGSGHRQGSFVKDEGSAKRELELLIGSIASNVSDVTIKSSLQGTRRYVSDFWGTVDKENNFRYAFVFDSQGFLRDNTDFPKVYESEALRQLAQQAGSNIENVRIFRRRLNKKVKKSTNRLGGNSFTQDFGNPDDLQIIGNLGKELLSTDSFAINNSNRYKYYTGTEERSSTDLPVDHFYKYGVEISYRDESSLLMETIIEHLEAVVDRLNKVFLKLSNSRTGEIEDIEQKELIGPNGIMNVSLSIAAELLSGVAKERLDFWKERLLNEDTGYFSRASSSERAEKVKELQVFFEQLSTVLRRETKINSRPKSQNALGGAGSAMGPRRISFHRQEFDGIIKEHRVKRLGYDYLSDDKEDQDPGLNTLTAQEYKDRISLETKKIFTGDASADLSTGKYSHLSPAFIRTPSVKINLRDERKKEDFNKALAEILFVNTQAEGNSLSLAIGSGTEVIELSAQNLGAQGTNITLDQGAVQPDSENTTPASIESIFGKISSEAHKQAAITLNTQVLDTDYRAAAKLEQKTAFAIKKKAMPKYNKPLLNVVGNMAVKPVGKGMFSNSFNSITDAGSEIAKKIENISSPHAFAIQEVSKALANGGSIDEVVNVSVPHFNLDVDFDPMKDFDQFATLWFTLKQVNTVEYLDGFNNGIHGEEWKELTRSVVESRGNGKLLLCRFRPFAGAEATAAGIGKLDTLEAPVFNEYFMIAGEQRQKIQLIHMPEFRPLNIRKEDIMINASNIFSTVKTPKLNSLKLNKTSRFIPRRAQLSGLRSRMRRI
jgi:hypothetical protein